MTLTLLLALASIISIGALITLAVYRANKYVDPMHDALTNGSLLPTSSTEETTPDWLPAEGYEGIEILVEHPVIVQVRTGPVGSRTYGKYRVPVDEIDNLGDFISDRVNEFFQNRAN